MKVLANPSHAASDAAAAIATSSIPVLIFNLSVCFGRPLRFG